MRPEKTTLEHANDLASLQGTLVEDTETGRAGHLMGGLIERQKESGAVVRRTAFIRPVGGGREWEVPYTNVRPVRHVTDTSK
ncbi:hypothetical protein ABZ547_13345 [Streptomyces sparsogenes]|uniref:hypothetical protein n=1 Tax=Streptomyces sparsogenes TaxID=67365 RepID=UPI0033CA7EC1